MIQALQEIARDCSCPVPKLSFFLCLVLCYTVLRSRWCQSGVKHPQHEHRSKLPFRVSGIHMRNVGG
jgi:hypothetical protein